MIELRDDQLQALDSEQQPATVVDPRTGQLYRLIKQEVYEVVCGIVRPFNRGVEDDPDMDVYEQYREEVMNRGEVVLVDWPYSDLSGTKIRPAICVQADFLNGLIDDTVYVKVQGNAYGIPDTEVTFDPADETASGLAKVSYASCRDLLTRDQTLIHHTLGILSDQIMEKIEQCLKIVLAIR